MLAQLGRAAPLREPAQADAARALLRGAARRATSRASSSFIRDQEAVGASQLEAVSEEEGADAVRLLTIHAAKGLEFKVVIVADAGRDTGGAPSADEILVAARRPLRLPGRSTRRPGKRKRRLRLRGGARGREARGERAERLRLYYVAMTRAVDRLIVSGAIDPRRARTRDADRLGARAARAATSSAPRRRAGRARARRRARSSSRVDRCGAGRCRARAPVVADDAGPARALRRAADRAGAARATGCPSSCRPDAAPLHRVRRLSYSALALFERCSYRYYAERVAGLRERARRRCRAADGLKATEIGDAVHRLLELVDLAAPRAARRRDRARPGTRR